MTAPSIDLNELIKALDLEFTTAGIPFGDSNRPTDVVQGSPYVVAFTDGGRVTNRTMKYRDGAHASLAVHTYAWSPESIRGARRKTLQAVFSLVGRELGGWQVQNVVHNTALPVEREDKMSPPLYWQTDDFAVRLVPV